MRALVLVGGGCKGIIQAGMLKRIHELDLQIDAIYGTSSGGLNAAMYSQGNIDLMIDLWMTIQNKDVKSLAPWKLLTQDCVYDSTPLAKTIAKYIDPSALKIPTYVTLTNTVTNSPVHARVDNNSPTIKVTPTACWQALLASTSIPIYFPKIAGLYYDGGIVDNYNVQTAIHAGADEIIICHPSRPSALGKANIFQVGEWSYETTMWGNYVHEMENNGLDGGAQDKLVTIGSWPGNKSSRIPLMNPVRVRVCIPDAPVNISILDFSYKGIDRAGAIDTGYQIAKRLIG